MPPPYRDRAEGRIGGSLRRVRYSSGGRVRSQATMAPRSASVMRLKYIARSIGSLNRRPSRDTLWVSARLISASVHPPIPAVGCDVMLRTTAEPNGPVNSKPPLPQEFL